MARETLDMREEEYDRPASPIQTRDYHGTEYRDEYRFNEVVMDFDPEEVFPSKPDFAWSGTALIYKYPGKPAVKVTRGGVKWKGKGDRKSAEKQAYHVLSMLDAKGYVRGWGKK